MSSADELGEFIGAAKGQGASDETVVGLLQGRGWPERDAYRALAAYYEGHSGVRVPEYKRSGTAGDAFLYLLSFIALAIWTTGLGSLMFSLIDRWIPDPLRSNALLVSVQTQIAGSLASIIVAFPIYMLLMFYIVRRVEVHPEKLDSPARKWLTYLALLVAASIALGDLVIFLTFLLRGGLTARFLAKDAVVLIIAGGVLWYYLLAMQKNKVVVKPAHE